ncbi:MAG: ribosome small subunit-dependent GTPase A [Treponema sp.]
MEGLVIAGTNNFFTVEKNDGTQLLCSLKGKVLKLDSNVYNPLCPGDIVEIEEVENEKGIITSLHKRKNVLTRLNIKAYNAQALASNIDLLICVTTPSSPPFRPRFVDRVMIQAEKENIPVLVLVNKIDLPQDSVLETRLLNWQKYEYEVLKVSAKENINIKALKERIKGLKVAVIGQSGVGKSSVLNALYPSLSLKTSKISYKYNRGVHTTTKAMLFKVEDSIIIDTPGIRNFSLWDIDEKELILYFRDMKEFEGKCKFALSCKHEKEDGCLVLKALNEGAILNDRYESYLRIKEEIRTLKRK